LSSMTKILKGEEGAIGAKVSEPNKMFLAKGLPMLLDGLEYWKSYNCKNTY
jgi:hypothetical protein